MTQNTETTKPYKVVGSGRGYSHKWWDVELDHRPDAEEVWLIAKVLDGGYLFGSRLDGSDKPGAYRIVGYTD